jgi:hypothetical protein
MEPFDEIEKLEASDVFKEWKKENRDAYLTHAFIMIDPNIKQEWQIGYYTESNDKITTFDISEKIIKNPPAEAFKKEGAISKLDIEKVKVPFEKAAETADIIQKQKYSRCAATNKIIILQTITKQVWNITYVSVTMETLNIKIDAETGEVISDSMKSLFKIE